MEHNELKPCPFCGGEARLRKLGKNYAVRCRQCGATGATFRPMPWHKVVFIAQGEARTAWNRRTNDGT